MNNLTSLIDKGLLWSAGSLLTRKAMPNSESIPLGINEIDCFLPHYGLPKGSINEWRCQDNFVPFSFLGLIAGQSINIFDDYVAWIGEETWPTPHSLYELSKNEQILTNSFFIKAQTDNEKIWLIDQTLKTKGIGLVIVHIDKIGLPTLRKFSLNARDNGIVLLLVRTSKAYKNNFCLFSRWEVAFNPIGEIDPCFNLKLSYCKGSLPENCYWQISFKDFRPEVVKLTENETFYRYLSTA